MELTPIIPIHKEKIVQIPFVDNVPASKVKISTQKFTKIEVVDASEVTKNVATIKNFEDANPGQTTTFGSANGEIEVIESIDNSIVHDKSTESNEIFYAV